jgi:hypothetical protein
VSYLPAQSSFQLQSEWAVVSGTTNRRSKRNPLSKRLTKPSLHFARCPGRGSRLGRGFCCCSSSLWGVRLMRGGTAFNAPSCARSRLCGLSARSRFFFRGLAHAPTHRITHLGSSPRLHTLFQCRHDVDDFLRCLALWRNRAPMNTRPARTAMDSSLRLARVGGRQD